MTKEEIKKKINELGILTIEDANNLQLIEDAIKAVEESNKTPKMIAAPLIIDGETDRKYFNTKEKIITYFIEKNIFDIDTQIFILEEIMNYKCLLSNNKKENLNFLIDKYLSYNWVYYK
jgi:hypothetical protein